MQKSDFMHSVHKNLLNMKNIVVTELMNSNIDIFCNEQDKLILLGKCFDPDYKKINAEEFYNLIKEEQKINIKKFNGIFSVILCHNDKVSLFNDRFGGGKLFYAQCENKIIVSDSIDNIMKATTQKFTIDFTAWAEYLAFHFVLGNRTFFNEIKSLYMGEKIEISVNNEIEHVSLDDVTQIERNAELSSEQAICEIKALLQQSISKVLNNNTEKEIMVPLSGGWDSRCLCGIVYNETHDFKTYTTYFDNGNNKEQVYAKLLSDKLGIENIFEDIDKDYYQKEIKGYLNETDYMSNLHVPFWNYYSTKIGKREAIAFDGYAGDLFFRFFYQDIKEDDNQEQWYNNCFAFYKMSSSESMVSKITKEFLDMLAFEGMKVELQRCNNNLLLFALANRNSRNISYSVKKLNEYVDVVCPFLNHKVVDYVFSMPDSIRKDKNFYRMLLQEVLPALIEVPSTNDTEANQYWSVKEIYKNAFDNVNLIKRDLICHPEDTLGVYSPEVAQTFFANYDYESSNNRGFKTIELFWYYQKWIKKYEEQLKKENLYYYWERNLASKRDKAEYFIVPVICNSERKNISRKWLQMFRENRTGEEYADVLLTMDVEGFQKENYFSKHTSDGEYFEKLVLGRVADNDSLLMRLTNSRDFVFTYFIEMYSDAYDKKNLAEVLKMCDSNGNEAAMHCHLFSLPKSYLQRHFLEYEEDFQKKVFDKALAEGVRRYKKILKKKPYSYRAGSFLPSENHFEILRKNGFKVDSSIYHGSKKDIEIKNELTIMDGIVQIPVTTFYDLQKGDRARRFDINSLDYEKKIELITRNILAGNNLLMMLSHSWSFFDAIQIEGSRKIYHNAFSQNAYDELLYMVDYIYELGVCNFKTCEDVHKDRLKVRNKNNILAVLNPKLRHVEKIETYQQKCVELVDVSGEAKMLPVYVNPPSRGILRDRVNGSFLDLHQGCFTSSVENASKISTMRTDGGIEVLLPNKLQPFKGDWTEYSCNIKVEAGQEYLFELLLACPYYKEKYEDRKRIKYSVLFNDEVKYSRFITEKDDESVKAYVKSDDTNVSLTLRLECIETEEPWSWGNHSKTVLKAVHYEKCGDSSRLDKEQILEPKNTAVEEPKKKNITNEKNNICWEQNEEGSYIFWNKITGAEYAWYVIDKDENVIHKTTYSKEPEFIYDLNNNRELKIKSFVRTGTKENYEKKSWSISSKIVIEGVLYGN